MKITQLLIATKNKGKFGEIAEVLGELPIKLFSLDDLGIKGDVEEHGETHEANAILKARYFFAEAGAGLGSAAGGMPTLGEDSGIYVDAFHGELGVKTRRWEGLGDATDKEWIEYFLKKMANVPANERGATFKTFAAVIIDEKSAQNPYIFSGETHGTITRELEAPLIPGIPISSCFKPDGCDKVYAALSQHEKNQLSHRGKAMRRVKEFLGNRG